MKNNPNPPICIASPLRRSGTTLIQRLICSASNGLIYGETCANDFQMISNLFTSKKSFLLQHKDWRNDQIKKVLKGEVNDWIPDLMPDIDSYINAYHQMIEALVNNYGAFAVQENRPVWGMKMPEWNPTNLVLLQQLLPDLKIIYLHRNLEDCVRSAKKIEMVMGIEEIKRFCFTWKQFSDYVKINLKGDNVLHLKYEDLIDDPDKWINEIESFSGAENIDRSVMKVKVNTYASDHKLAGKKEPYLDPAALTEEEQSVVDSYLT